MTEGASMIWQALSDELSTWPDAAMGKMMSAPAVTRNGKVFAFYSAKGAYPGFGFRIGRATDPDTLGLSNWQYLAPFKTKPPMKDWIIVGTEDANHLRDLAKRAYDGLT